MLKMNRIDTALIATYCSNHHIYVDLFGTGKDVFLEKQRSFGEVYNDIDGKITQLFRDIRHWGKYDEQLKPFIDRMRGVVIECIDPLKLISLYDMPETVFYVDLTSDFCHKMKDTDHAVLAEILKLAQGSVLVFGYRSNLFKRLYTGWERIESWDADMAIWMKKIDPRKNNTHHTSTVQPKYADLQSLFSNARLWAL
jgi:site-specific DNA-adenine methylase